MISTMADEIGKKATDIAKLAEVVAIQDIEAMTTSMQLEKLARKFPKGSFMHDVYDKDHPRVVRFLRLRRYKNRSAHASMSKHKAARRSLAHRRKGQLRTSSEYEDPQAVLSGRGCVGAGQPLAAIPRPFGRCSNCWGPARVPFEVCWYCGDRPSRHHGRCCPWKPWGSLFVPPRPHGAPRLERMREAALESPTGLAEEGEGPPVTLVEASTGT